MNDGWIYTKDRMPEKLTHVLVCYILKSDSTGETHRRIAIAEYIPPRTVYVSDYIDPDEDYDFNDCADYDQERDEAYVNESWYEKAWENNDYGGWYLCDANGVIAWRPLPDLPKDE